MPSKLPEVLKSENSLLHDLGLVQGSLSSAKTVEFLIKRGFSFEKVKYFMLLSVEMVNCLMPKCQFRLDDRDKDQPYYVSGIAGDGDCSNDPEEGSDFCKEHTKKCDDCGGSICGRCYQNYGPLDRCERDYCEKCGCLTHGVEI